MVPPPGDSSERAFWAAILQTHLALPETEVRQLALGVVYLRLLSVQFEKRRTELRHACRDPRSIYFALTDPERDAVLERREAYLSAHVAWVAPAARWETVRNTPGPLLPRAISAATLTLELDNPGLDGVFPRDYRRAELRPDVLAGWVQIVDRLGSDHAAAPFDVLSALTHGRFERRPATTPAPVPAAHRQRMNTLRSLTTGQTGFGKLLDRLDDQLRELDRLMERNRKMRTPDEDA